MEFLPYPRLLATLFNGCAFGPPPPFTAASAWARVDHPVSGLRVLTLWGPVPPCALLTLGFPPAPRLPPLNLAGTRSSPDRSTGSTRSRPCGAPAACGRRVSGSLSLPSRGPFHLSLTVLCSIGHWVVFSLAGWSPRLPTGFLVSRGTLDPAAHARRRLRGSHPLRPAFPGPFHGGPHAPCAVLNPGARVRRFGLLRFRSPLLPESMFSFKKTLFFLFLRLLRCFSSPGSPRAPMDSARGGGGAPPPGSPIRTPMDHCPCAAPHGFSQLAASFVGSQCLGIRPAPWSA